VGIPPGMPMPVLTTALGRMVFDALQKYGAYVVDQCGGAAPIIQIQAGVDLPQGFSWPIASDVDAIGPLVQLGG
jgi:hypothetical protein